MSTTDKPMHTPAPWDYDDGDFSIYKRWTSNPITGSLDRINKGKANAAHIVRCVNSHDALVEALTNAILKMGNAARLMGSSDEAIESLLEPFRAALKLAKGEK